MADDSPATPFIGEFYGLLTRVSIDTQISSNPSALAEHPALAYLATKAGEFQPFITSALKKGNYTLELVFMLNNIVDAQPFPDEAMGDINAMAQAWQNWLSENAIADNLIPTDDKAFNL